MTKTTATLAKATLALLAATALTSVEVKAQTTWSPTAGGTSLTNGANWTGGSAPANNTAWVFGASLNAFLNNDFVPNWTNTGITFSAGAPAYTISGNALTLGGNIANNSVNTAVFNTPFTLNGTRTVQTTNTGGNLVFNGAIGGNYALTVAGSGLTYLNTANTFSGLTFQAGSTVVAKNTNAFGAGGINLANSVNGATIFLATDVTDNFGNNLGGLNAGGGTVKLVSDRNTAGSGVTHTLGNMTNNPGSTTDVIALKGGNVTSGSAMIGLGTVTGGSAAGGSLVLLPYSAGLQIGSIAWTAPTNNNTGTLFLAGSVASNTLGGTISNTVSGSFTSTNSLEKDGPSTWFLTGSNSATGTTKVAGGTLVLDYSNNTGAKLPSGLLNLAGGTIRLNTGNGTAVESIGSTTLSGGQNQILQSGSTPNKLALKTLTIGGGALNVGSGAASVNGITAGNLIAGGRVTFNGSDFATVDVNSNVVAYSAYTTLPTSGSTNTGNYVLTGSLTTAAAVAYNTLKLSSSTGSTNTLSTTTNAAITGASNSAILVTGSDDWILNSGTGKINSSDSLRIQHWGTGMLTLGPIGSGFEKYGTGTMTLAGVSQTTASSYINAGAVVITNNNSIATNINSASGFLYINGGALVGDTRNASFAMDNNGSNNRPILIGLNGGTLDVLGNGTLTISGQICNDTPAANYSAPITIGSSNTTGTIALSAMNTFQGGVNLIGGTLLLACGNTTTNFSPGVSFGTNSTTITITNTNTTAGLVVGQSLSTSSSGVKGAIITSIVDSTHFTISTLPSATNGANATVTILAGGALGAASSSSSGQNFNYITFNGGTLKYSSNNNVDYSSRFALDANQKFKIDTAGQNITFATGLSGAGSVLTKFGAGTLTLAGPAAVVPYSGGTVINAGTVKLANPSAVVTGNLTLADNTLFDLAGNGATVTGITANSGLGLISNSSTTNAVLTVSNADNATNIATLAGGSSLGLTKAGTGTLTLAGNNSYSGSTLVAGGQLVIPTGNGLTNSTVTVGTFGSLTVATNATVAGITNNGLVQFFGTSGPIVNNGSLTGTGTAGNVTLNAGSTITSGGISGTTNGSLTFSNLFINGGTYNWNLQTSSNGLSDAYDQIIVNNQVSFASSLSNTPFVINFITNASTVWDTTTNNNLVNTYNIITANSITNFNRNFFQVNQPDPTIGSFSIGYNSKNIFLTFSRPGSTIQLFSDTGQSIYQNDADKLSQLPGGGASTPVIIAGGGEIVLDQSNDFSGPIVIGSGTLTAANTGALGYSAIINLGTATNGGSNSVLNFTTNAVGIASRAVINVVGTGSNSIQNASGGAVSLSGGIKLSTNVSISTVSPSDNLQLSGPVTGGGSVTMAGPGVITLTGTNTYSGGSSLNGSTLAVSGNSALGSGTLFLLSSSKIQAVGTATITNSVSVANGSKLTLDAAGQALTAAGAISGNAAVGVTNSTGNGTVTLSGANSYTGGTTLNGGSLILTTLNALGTGTLTVNSSGGTVKQTVAQALAGPIVLGTNSVTIDLGNTALTPSSDFSGSGSITINNSGGLTFIRTNGFTGTLTVNSGTITINTNLAITNMLVGVNGSGALYNYGTMGSVLIGGNGNTNNANGTIVPGAVNAYASNASFAGPVTISGPSAGKIVPIANNVPNNTVYNGPSTLTLNSSNITLPLSASNSIKVGDTIDGGFSTKGSTTITSITTNSTNLIVNLSGTLKNTNLPGITTGSVQFYRLDGTSQLVGTNYGYAQFSGTATSGVTVSGLTVDGRLDILSGLHNLTGISGTPNSLQSNYVGGGSGGIFYSSTVSNNLGFTAGSAFSSFIFSSANTSVVGLTQSGTGTTYFGMFGENQATNASATFYGGNWAIGQVGQNNGGEHGSATITLANNAQVTLGGNVFSSGPANIGGTAYTTGVFNVNQGKIVSLGDLETLACDFGTTKSLSAYMQMNVATNGALDVQGKMQLGNNVVGGNGVAGTITSPNGNSLNINGGLVKISKGLIFGADTSFNTWGGTTVNDRNSVTLGSGTLSVGSDGIMIGYVGTNVIVNSVARTVTGNQNTLTVNGGKLITAGAISASDSSWLTGSTVTNSFVWNGGQVTALSINASNANWNGAQSSITGNTLYNSNGTLAPGDLGTAGLTTINGNYVQGGGNSTLALDLGGINRANAFTVGQGSGGYSDYLNVTGSAVFSNTKIALNPNWYTLGNGNTRLVLVGGASSLTVANIGYLWTGGSTNSTVTSADNAIAVSVTNSGNSLVANVTLNQWTNGQGNWGSGGTAVWTRGVDTTNGAASFAAFGTNADANLDQAVTVHAVSFQGPGNVVRSTNGSVLTLSSADGNGVIVNNNAGGTNKLGVSVAINDTLLLVGSGYLNVSGNVTGTNGVIAAGTVASDSGTVMALTGSNSYSGTTVVSSAALQTTYNPFTTYTVSPGANLIAVLGGANGWSDDNLTAQAAGMSNAILSLDASLLGSSTVSAGIFTNSSSGLTLGTYGTGTVALDAGVSYDGVKGLLVNGGTLDLGNTNRAFPLGTVLASGTIASGTLSSDVNFTGTLGGGVSSVIADGTNKSSSVTMNGNGTLTLSGINTFSGGATVGRGTLAINGQSALGTGTTTVVGGTLDLGNVTVTPDYGTMNLASGVIRNGFISSASSFQGLTNGTISASLTGSGGLNLTNAAAKLVLSGANDYSGDTILGAGILQTTFNGSTKYIVTNAGTTLIATVGSVNPWNAGKVAEVAATMSNSTIGVDASSSDAPFALTSLANSLGGVTLRNVGTGTLVLQNGGDFTGIAQLSLSSGTVDLNGGTLSPTNTYGTNLFLGGGVLTNGTLLVAGSIYASVGSSAPAIAAVNLTGAGSLSKWGAGTLFLTGSNSFSGGSTINNGTVVASSQTALGTGAVSVNGTGTLDFAGNTLNADSQPLSMSAGMLTNGYITADNSLTNLTGGTISARVQGGASLVKRGSGTLTLASSNTYTGGTFVNTGSLVMGNTSALGSGGVTVSGGTLDMGGSSLNVDAQALSVSSGLVTNGAITANNALTNLIGGTIAVPISGAASIYKNGGGTLTLASANSYSGGTVVNAGALVMGNATALGSGSVTVSGGALNLGGNSVNLDSQSISLTSGSITNGTVSSATTFDSLANGTVAASLTGAGSLTHASGTLTLSGNNSYSGGSYINGGALVLGSATANGSGPVVVRSGLLDLGGLPFDVSTLKPLLLGGTIGNGTITSSTDFNGLAAGSGTVTAGLSGAGSLAIGASSTLTLSGSNSASWIGKGYLDGGKLILGNNAAIGTSGILVRSNNSVLTASTNIASTTGVVSITNGAGLTVDAAGKTLVISGGVAGAGSLTVSSSTGTGTVILTGSNNTISGGFTIAGNGNTNTSAAGNATFVASNATLSANFVIAAPSTGKIAYAGPNMPTGAVGTNYGYALISGGVTATNLVVNGRLDIGTGSNALSGITGAFNSNTNFVGGGSGVIAYNSTISNNLGFVAGGAFSGFYLGTNASVSLTQSGSGTTSFGIFGQPVGNTNVATGSAVTFNGGKWAIGQFGQNNSYQIAAGTFTLVSNAAVTVGGNSGAGGVGLTHGTFNVSSGTLTFNGATSQGGGGLSALTNTLSLNVGSGGTLTVNGLMTLGVSQNGEVVTPSTLTLDGGKANLSGLTMGNSSSTGVVSNDVIAVTVNNGTLSVGNSGIMVGYSGTNQVVNGAATLTLGGGTLTTTGTLAAPTNVNAASTIASTFNWTGGTLSAKTIDTTSTIWTNGNISTGALTQTNGSLSVGSVGTAILGDYNFNGGTLAVSLGSGTLNVSGNAVAAGGTTLALGVTNFAPIFNASSTNLALVTASNLDFSSVGYRWQDGTTDSTNSALNGQVGLTLLQPDAKTVSISLDYNTITGSNWFDSNSWSRSIVPNGQDYFALIGASNAVNFDANATISALRFAGDGNVINGAGTLSFTSWSSSNSGSRSAVFSADNATNIIAVPLSMGSAANFLCGSNGLLRIAGGLTVAGTGTSTFDGGNIILSGSNTFAGGISVNSGTLLAETSNSLGRAVLSVRGGTLDLGNNGFTMPGDFTMTAGAVTNGSLTATNYNLSGGTVGSSLGEGIANITGLSSNVVRITGSLAATNVNISANGTLLTASSNALSTSASVNFSGAAGQINTLDLGGQSLSIQSLNSTGLATARVVDSTGGAGLTLTGNSSFGGILAHSGATTIAKDAVLDLGTTGKITSSGAVNVTGGTLLLGASSQLNAASAVNLGGKIGLGQGFSQTIGSLTLTANSVIDFSGIAGSSLTIGGTFDNSSGYTLSIYNWSGGDRFTLSLGANALNGGLSKITFFSDSGNTLLADAGFIGSEIVPVPEPCVVFSGLLLVAWMLFAGRRRIEVLLTRLMA